MKHLLTIDDKAFVSYLADIFEKLNILNQQLQGTNKILVDAKAKIFGFITNIKLYICGMQPKAKHSLRAQAQLMRTETVETFELVKVKQKLLDMRAELEQRKREAAKRTREVREQALPSEYHRQTYL
ncbi:hypothetical protein TNCV_3404631 [Trichonephila clavipes]|nr:hypothetical protein TNCV_3404631 [Trichonephila clavipes]